MDEIGGARGRKGDASASASSSLTPPRGPGRRLPSPPPPPPPLLPPPASGSSALPPLPTQPSADSAVLALPAAGSEMDGGGGGEALLVRRSSKAKKRPADRESAGAGDDRFRALWRDYHDVLGETEEKRQRLASAKRRKLSLLAEVKFLRKKYEFLLKASSQQTHYKLKKQARRIPSPVGSSEADHGAGTEAPSTSKSPNLDSNQDSAMNDRWNNAQRHQGHPEYDKFDQVGVEEDMTTDVKLSVCRDRNSPGSDDKRVIPWQDRLALKA